MTDNNERDIIMIDNQSRQYEKLTPDTVTGTDTETLTLRLDNSSK